MNQETSTAVQGQGARKGVRIQWPGSPWKQGLTTSAVPAGSRRRCLAQDSAGMDGVFQKKRPGKGPQNPRQRRA